MAGVVAATLTLLAAIIGLITVLVDGGGGSGSSAAGPSVVTETTETGGGGSGPQEPDSGAGKGPLDPAHDGNTRGSAKRLPANQAVVSTLVAGNDEDWYVYEASKDETATVEVVTVGEDSYGRIINAILWEGLKEIESSSDASSSEPFVVPWVVAPGTRLFVNVNDSCGELGCSIGAYKVVVRTSPPG